MDYKTFIKNTLAAKRPTRRRSVYPREMLKAAEVLHFQHGIDAKTIAEGLLKEPEWANHTFPALHGRICRHLRIVRGSSPK